MIIAYNDDHRRNQRGWLSGGIVIMFLGPSYAHTLTVIIMNIWTNDFNWALTRVRMYKHSKFHEFCNWNIEFDGMTLSYVCSTAAEDRGQSEPIQNACTCIYTQNVTIFCRFISLSEYTISKI